METKILDLGAINGQVSVQIIRKNIKNVHLKVFRNLDVVLSVPMTVPSDWIDSFLNNHIVWIDDQICNGNVKVFALYCPYKAKKSLS